MTSVACPLAQIDEVRLTLLSLLLLPLLPSTLAVLIITLHVTLFPLRLCVIRVK